MDGKVLSDKSLLEAQQLAKLKIKDNLSLIFSKLSHMEQCSVIFLTFTKQDLTASGYALCQYSAKGQDISERVWHSCSSSADVMLAALCHIYRFDLLERPLGLCSTHSIEQVCSALSGLDADRLALYRVFAALPQTETDHLLRTASLPSWQRPPPGRPLEETFCRSLRPGIGTADGPGSYFALLTEFCGALLARGHADLAKLLTPFVADTRGPMRGVEGRGYADDEVYPLPTCSPHGLCIIINVNTFIEPKSPMEEEYPPRRGSDIDTLRLEGTFRLFGFQVLTLIDPDLHKIRDVFDNLRDDVRLSRVACLAVCVMTHGDENDHLLLHDRTRLSLSDLRLYCFSPLLVNRPRLFFVQACRGTECMGDTNTILYTDAGGGRPQVVSPVSDCLVCAATVHGYVAMRSQSQGSWFISDLCHALQRLGHVRPVQSVMQEARRALSARVDRFHSSALVTQCSEDITTLRKQVQLVRGCESDFCSGAVLLLLLDVLDQLVEDALDAFCRRLLASSAAGRGVVEAPLELPPGHLDTQLMARLAALSGLGGLEGLETGAVGRQDWSPR